MRVGFATDDYSRSHRSLGGAGHYRLGIVADALARNGIPTAVGAVVHQKGGRLGVCPLDALDLDDDERRARYDFDFDVIVLQRGMWPGLRLSMEAARRAGQRIVNDLDDHFDGIPITNRAWLATIRGGLNSGADVVEYRKALAASDLITCSTPFLARWYSRYAPTVVIRNAIDLARWPARTARSEASQLGWVGVTSHRSRDLEVLRDVLPEILGQSGYEARFYHGGSTDIPEAARALGLDPEALISEPMEPIDRYPRLFMGLDVGVVPLSGVPFNHAKSAIKGMEYAASGIPFVASTLPEYRWLHQHYGIGRLAPNALGWVRELRRLGEDPDEAAAEARENRRAVAALDIEERWPEWADVYATLRSRRPAISRRDRRARALPR